MIVMSFVPPAFHRQMIGADDSGEDRLEAAGSKSPKSALRQYMAYDDLIGEYAPRIRNASGVPAIDKAISPKAKDQQRCGCHKKKQGQEYFFSFATVVNAGRGQEPEKTRQKDGSRDCYGTP